MHSRERLADLSDSQVMNDVETRHSHGSVRHDHEGGEVSHKHWPGDPRLTEEQEKTLGGGGASAAFSFGTILIVFGGLLWLWQSGNHSACSSVLVQAANPGPCQLAGAAWDLGVLGIVVGVALIIVGAILRGK